jgi:hypothetical protein
VVFVTLKKNSQLFFNHSDQHAGDNVWLVEVGVFHNFLTCEPKCPYHAPQFCVTQALVVEMAEKLEHVLLLLVSSRIERTTTRM